jgi:histidinol phosphatase-like enzyme (inositol monophosphatase family)
MSSRADQDRQDRFEFAREISQQAASLTLKYFGEATLPVERKTDDTPVTIADREAERLLRKAIARRFPNDSITGEEFGQDLQKGPFHWILDPIDGTKSFICGVPLYGTLVAVLEENQPLLGVIQLPALSESVYAMNGQGTWHQRADGPPRAARVSNCQALCDAVFVTSERRLFDQCRASHAMVALESRCKVTRTWGDCYGYALVATGRADIMIDPQLQVWDAAPMVPVLAEAGGSFTDWQGNARADGGSGIATNRQLLPSVLELLASH